MANQLFLLLWLLPSLMTIGLPGVSSLAFYRAQYPPRNDLNGLWGRVSHHYLSKCYFGITGPDSDSDVPRISLYACDETDKDLETSLAECTGTVGINVWSFVDEAQLVCYDFDANGPKYIVQQFDPPVYDVARFGPSTDEHKFTTVISSSILVGNKEKRGVPIKFMMETGGEVLLQIGGVEPNREKAILRRDLIFEPLKVKRDRTTLAFIYPNGQIAYSPSFLKGEGYELEWQPHFAMFFSNDKNDGHVIGKGGDAYDLACSLNHYKSSYKPMSHFILDTDLFSKMKQCVTTCPAHSSPSLRSSRRSSDRSSRRSSDRSSRRSSDRSSRRSSKSSSSSSEPRLFETMDCNIL